jgi:hypothetical protein
LAACLKEVMTDPGAWFDQLSLNSFASGTAGDKITITVLLGLTDKNAYVFLFYSIQ